GGQQQRAEQQDERPPHAASVALGLREDGDDLLELREATLLLLREDQLTVGEHVELALLAGDDLGLVLGSSVELGRETRGPAVVAASDRAVVDLDLHGSEGRYCPSEESRPDHP